MWSNKWLVTEVNNQVHAVPVNDAKEHQFYEGCWCIPRIVNGKKQLGIVHNAKDLREFFEKSVSVC